MERAPRNVRGIEHGGMTCEQLAAGPADRLGSSDETQEEGARPLTSCGGFDASVRCFKASCYFVSF